MKKYHHVTVGKKKSGDRVRTIPFGASIRAIIAYPKRGKGKGRTISLRFSPGRYTLAEARTWAKSHGYRILGTAKAGTTTKRTLKKKTKKKGRRKVTAKKFRLAKR